MKNELCDKSKKKKKAYEKKQMKTKTEPTCVGKKNRNRNVICMYKLYQQVRDIYICIVSSIYHLFVLFEFCSNG